MSYSKITLRYAAAFFELTEERKMIESTSNDMVLLNSVCSSNRDFVQMIKNPVVHIDKKKKIIEKIFSEKVNKISLSFMLLMVRKRRERYLPSIAEAYNDLYKEFLGIKTAYVSSAIELNETEKSGIMHILGTLTDKKIELQEKTDKNLLGGFIVNIDNYQVDQSLTTKIKELKKDFEKNLFIKGF